MPDSSIEGLIPIKKWILSRKHDALQIHFQALLNQVLELIVSNFLAHKILDFSQKVTILSLLWFTQERLLNAISFNRIEWGDSKNGNAAFDWRKWTLDSETHKKQQFSHFCCLPKTPSARHFCQQSRICANHPGSGWLAEKFRQNYAVQNCIVGYVLTIQILDG